MAQVASVTKPKDTVTKHRTPRTECKCKGPCGEVKMIQVGSDLCDDCILDLVIKGCKD